MMYEIIIGLGVLVYIVWKYFISAKAEQKLESKDSVQTPVFDEKRCEKCKDIKVKEPLIKPAERYVANDKQSNNLFKDNVELITDTSLSQCIKLNDQFKAHTDKYEHVLNESAELKTENLSKHLSDSFKDPIVRRVRASYDHEKDIQQEITKVIPNGELLTPSLLLKQQKEKALNEKIGKRESPPKERLAEFLEKTIFSDDKIQSIIDNLSLHQNEVKNDSQISIENSTQNGNTISEKASRLQNSIDQIADRIKSLNNNNATNKNDEPVELENQNIVEKRVFKESVQTECDGQLEENKPLLKRIQNQSGFPVGLNFGSVIGELKNRTKNASNGALKPVFRKFDSDTVDNVQACFLCFCSYPKP